jgi:hypothetical protein
MMAKIPKPLEEINDGEICKYCEFTRHGESVNTNQFNLCEGRRCPRAYEGYLEECEEDNAED